MFEKSFRGLPAVRLMASRCNLYALALSLDSTSSRWMFESTNWMMPNVIMVYLALFLIIEIHSAFAQTTTGRVALTMNRYLTAFMLTKHASTSIYLIL